MFFSRSRRGFTLVELLVVIAIIGILVALLLPAVQAAREAARRSQCSNNLKQIALALHNYHDTYKRFPPDAIWITRNKPPAAVAGEERNFTWIALLLPFVEQQGLHNQINFRIPALNQVLPSGQPIREIVLDNFLCPTDTPFPSLPVPQNAGFGFGYTSYAANGGWDGHRRLYGDNFRAGVLNTMDGSSLSDVRDGTSNTFMVAETTNRSYCCRPNPGGDPNRWKGGAGRVRQGAGEPVFRSLIVAPVPWVNNHAWINAGGGPLLQANGTAAQAWGSPPWQAPYAFYPMFYGAYPMNNEWPGAGSSHPGGAQLALADASVRFVSETISTGGVGGAVGDNLGRFGNIWSGAHFIQGHPQKTPVTLP